MCTTCNKNTTPGSPSPAGKTAQKTIVVDGVVYKLKDEFIPTTP